MAIVILTIIKRLEEKILLFKIRKETEAQFPKDTVLVQ